MEAQLPSTNYRRPLIIQGRLENPCDAIATMPGTTDSQLISENYKKLVIEKSTESKEEVIIGSVLESRNLVHLHFDEVHTTG